jgi:hypothetical protein
LLRSENTTEREAREEREMTYEAPLQVTLRDTLVNLLRLETHLNPPTLPNVLISLPSTHLQLRVRIARRNHRRNDPLSGVEKIMQSREIVLLIRIRVVIRLITGSLEALGELGGDVGDGDVGEELGGEGEDEFERADGDDLAEDLGARNETLWMGTVNRRGRREGKGGANLVV